MCVLTQRSFCKQLYISLYMKQVRKFLSVTTISKKYVECSDSGTINAYCFRGLQKTGRCGLVYSHRHNYGQLVAIETLEVAQSRRIEVSSRVRKIVMITCRSVTIASRFCEAQLDHCIYHILLLRVVGTGKDDLPKEEAVSTWILVRSNRHDYRYPVWVWIDRRSVRILSIICHTQSQISFDGDSSSIGRRQKNKRNSLKSYSEKPR